MLTMSKALYVPDADKNENTIPASMDLKPVARNLNETGG